MEESAIERLQAKSPEEAIVEQISRDFNLAPFMAKTQFEQMRQYFEHYFGLERDVGQMIVLAVSADDPPGRPMSECKRVPVNLTVDSADDLEALRWGIAALRRSKIQRLTREAQEQGALLTQEDLAAALDIKQPSLSKLESQNDMQISTLRRVIHALGGSLELVAHLPGGDIRISQFKEAS